MHKHEVIDQLKRSIATASNDDRSAADSLLRQRHVERITAISNAIEFLENLPEKEGSHHA